MALATLTFYNSFPQFCRFFHLFAKTHTSPSYSITVPLKVTLTFKVRCQLYKVSLCDEDSSVVFVKRVKIFNVLLNISNIFLGILLSLEFLYVGDNEILLDCQHSLYFFPDTNMISLSYSCLVLNLLHLILNCSKKCFCVKSVNISHNE